MIKFRITEIQPMFSKPETEEIGEKVVEEKITTALLIYNWRKERKKLRILKEAWKTYNTK